MKFKYQNISDIVHMLDVLGQGSFGVVYRGKVVDYSCTTRWELNDQEIAIKSIELTDQNIHEHERELDFMQNLKCPYIVNFLDCYIFRNRLWIMMELCEGGSLADILILEQNIKHEGFLKAVMAYW
jgi:serine/threonine protein kinase